MRLEAWIKETLPRGGTKREPPNLAEGNPHSSTKNHTYLLQVTDVALDEAGPGRHGWFVSLAILAVTGP